MKLALNADRIEEGKGKDWYMANNENLKEVTSASSNPALGILSMTVSGPTGNGEKARVVARVEVETPVGWFDVTVFHAKDDASNLYTAIDSRGYDKEDGTKGYREALRLKVPAKAQILRHVRSLCEESVSQAQAQTQAVAQPQAQAVQGIDPVMFAQYQAFVAMQQQQQQAQPVAQAQGAVQPSIPSIIGQGDMGAF